MVVLAELARHGCHVVCSDRPLPSAGNEPHEQLVVQIRGAVAEYERTLIADRMRRGRQAKLRSGRLLPWTRPPYGSRVDAERPRDPAGVRLDAAEAAVVQELCTDYVAGGVTRYALAQWLPQRHLPTPTGRKYWNVSTVRGLLTNPAYTGRAIHGRWRTTPARQRWSPLRPVGSGESGRPTPPDEWIMVPVPALVTEEVFAHVQRRLPANQQGARRSTLQPYLLRGLVSCGVCPLACLGRTRDMTQDRYRYSVCRGTAQPAVAGGRETRCVARFMPATQLDALVWTDRCAVLAHPALVAQALERAQGEAWLPAERQRRRHALHSVQADVARQRERLREAYLAGAVELPTFERQDAGLRAQQDAAALQERELVAEGQRLVAVSAVARSTTEILTRLRATLAQATFEQRRQLVALLIDRVVVTKSAVAIRYVIPATEASLSTRFCHLRTDYFNPPAAAFAAHEPGEMARQVVGDQVFVGAVRVPEHDQPDRPQRRRVDRHRDGAHAQLGAPLELEPGRQLLHLLASPTVDDRRARRDGPDPRQAQSRGGRAALATGRGGLAH